MKTQTRYIRSSLAAVATGLSLLTISAFADAPLKTALDLQTDQAAAVDAIQKKTRDAVRPVRGELKREERALRRAKTANDAEAIATQEKVIEPLRKKLTAIFESESEQIRALLTHEQKEKYQRYLKERDEMVGSSRDVRSLSHTTEKPKQP